MFILMLVIYGGFVLAMGLLGSEPELVALGLVMIFLGNLHRLGRAIIKSRKRSLGQNKNWHKENNRCFRRKGSNWSM
jgi:hypothetical protein